MTNHSSDKTQLIDKALERVLKPIKLARGLPNSCYVDPDVFALERERVFVKGWACIGFTKDVPNVGDVSVIDFAGMPLLILRDRNKKVSVFHNVCQHRGRKLVDESTNVTNVFICPYHNWTYCLDGTLLSTPHIGGPDTHSSTDFHKENIKLKSVRCAEWFGLIFINLSGRAEAFTDYIQPITKRWQEFMPIKLVHAGEGGTIKYLLKANWKLAVENYCEAYHLPSIHPNLNAYSPLNAHYPILEKTYSGQGTTSYDPMFPPEIKGFPKAQNLDRKWKTGAEYISLYPNVLLGIHQDHFYAVLLLPEGTSCTRERLELFYFDKAALEPSFKKIRARNYTLWQSIFNEDRNPVEGMQKGRESPGFDGGTFSPVMDKATHAFHSWVAKSLL